MIVAVVVIFLAALPFTGLQPLWETGNGTALLIGMNIFALFFANAVYQPGRRPPYPAIVHRLLYAGTSLLPIISMLALYGMYLRIAQYGWTVERCWALVICILLALFSAGYSLGIVRRRDDWPETLGRVNVLMGSTIVALMLLVNTPLLDFRSRTRRTCGSAWSTALNRLTCPKVFGPSSNHPTWHATTTWCWSRSTSTRIRYRNTS